MSAPPVSVLPLKQSVGSGNEVADTEVAVGRIAEEAVVAERVVDQRVAPIVVQALSARHVRPARAGRAAVRIRDHDRAPGAVVDRTVVHDRVVAPAGEGHAGADWARPQSPRPRDVGVVVVMDLVVDEHPAGVRVRDRAYAGRDRLRPAVAGCRRSGCWCRNRPGCCRTREFSISIQPPEFEPE